jgi:hypothetical protein
MNPIRTPVIIFDNKLTLDPDNILYPEICNNSRFSSDFLNSLIIIFFSTS